MSEENKAALRRMMDMFLTGDVGAADELVSPDCLDHQEMPGVNTNGVEGFKRVVAIYRDAFSDLSIEYIALIAEGDRVVAQVRMRGKNTGSFMGRRTPLRAKARPPEDMHSPSGVSVAFDKCLKSAD